MKLLTRLLKRLGISLKVEQAAACVVCGQGANPALGVPIPTIEGTWKHLVCMTVGRQIAQAADQSINIAGLVPDEEAPRPVILAIVHPVGREIWN